MECQKHKCQGKVEWKITKVLNTEYRLQSVNFIMGHLDGSAGKAQDS